MAFATTITVLSIALSHASLPVQVTWLLQVTPYYGTSVKQQMPIGAVWVLDGINVGINVIALMTLMLILWMALMLALMLLH